MVWPIVAVVLGLILLIWSANRFVDGACGLAQYFGMSPMLIGMLIVGFGTSAPEMIVSALAASQGNPGIALGNAYGSNITNIALILGLTSLISPILVQSQVLRKELPLLTAVTALAVYQLWDMELSRANALVLLGVFFLLVLWSIREGMRQKGDVLGKEITQELATHRYTLKGSLLWSLVGLALLIVASRALVWGSILLARRFGVSDLIIGLTIVAVGTSLPELASSLAAIRKKEHDIALGNVLGSNLFNTLAVVGLAGTISPMKLGPEVLIRDLPVMGGLTLSLFIFGFGFKGVGRINRVEGGILLASFLAYTVLLVRSAVSGLPY
jgi:cation:H+ antiporter